MKILLNVAVLFIIVFSANAQKQDSVFFTTGIKIGEVSDTSVVIWTRLCSANKPNPVTHERRPAPYRAPLKFNAKKPVHEMDGEVAGSFGEVKVLLKSKNHNVELDWEFVSVINDYTYKKYIGGLHANTTYTIEVLGRQFKGRTKRGVVPADKPSTKLSSKFSTAPSSKQIVPVTFTSSTCQYYWDFDDAERGFKIYDTMRKLNPSFHCQTGDFVYYDKPGPMALTIEQARLKWHAINAWPGSVDFYNEVPLYIQKDDHDLLSNDAHPEMDPFGKITYEDGLKIWYEQVPLEGVPYRTFRWGKDLQIWLPEGREYRSNNSDPDSETKTILGQAQIDWLKETVEKSDATFKVFISATPVVGPDRGKGKNDNHANDAFKTEGDWLRQFLVANDMFVINGDRHWQYVSKDDKTGLMEFSTGASSDCHAQGWDQNDKRPQHKFLRVAGGFVSVNVYRKKNTPVIEILHHDVDGKIVNKEIIKNK